jgi:hypothetical protein
MTAGGGSQNTTTGSCWQSPLSLFYMLLSIDNTHLCCSAVSPRFLLYVHAHYDSLCHPTPSSRDALNGIKCGDGEDDTQLSFDEIEEYVNELKAQSSTLGAE